MNKQYEYLLNESLVQKKWKSEKTYSLENNPGKFYSIDTPPPGVSGNLHIGHIFSYTQTDIIARYKRMKGFSVFYPFGFDDNGLPTERYVEKKCNIRANQGSRSEFIKLCLDETYIVEQQFIDLWQRMGLSANFDQCYSTISPLVQKLSQESFILLFNKGFIYRKYDPALYCMTCRTSVAQAELDDIQKTTLFNDIIFKDVDGNNVIISTTRPELLPSCVALLFNPKDARYRHLQGKQAIVPLFGYSVPFLADEKVAIEKGTGLVMCCTFGDKTDIEWYKKFKLPYKQSIDLDGRFVSATDFLAGLKVDEARAVIIQKLREQELLVRQVPLYHSVNVHERCKKEIEFIAIEQWFVNVLDHKQKFLDMADRISWHPIFMKARYRDWVENLSWDWCISRQRFFGIPFPVWHCKQCKHVLLADIKQLPIDPQDTVFGEPCNNCGSLDIMPDADVMDTWNTSALTPYICFALYQQIINSSFSSSEDIAQSDEIIFENSAIHTFLPMSMRPQAHDIIRTWAFDTIVKTWMHHDSIPWEDIIISGHVLTQDKEKISKSKENSLLIPENLLKKYPADAIRYWTATGNLGYDCAFSENQLKVGQRLITKLWNAFLFIKEHNDGLVVLEKPSAMSFVNEWILHSLSRCFEQYIKYFEANEFGLALQQIERFFWHDFCDNYLELIKSQLFHPQEYDVQAIYATRWTLNHVGLRILQLYAPYIPHVTEIIYENLYRDLEKVSSLHQTKFIDMQQLFVFEQVANTMEHVIALIALVRKIKTETKLSLKTPLESLTIYSNNHMLFDHIEQYDQMLRGITQAKKIDYVEGFLEVNQIEQKDGLWYAKINY